MQVSKKIAIRAGAALAATAIAVGTVGFAATGADAASSAHRAKQVYFVIGGNENHEVAIAHGAFSGGGRDNAAHENYDIIHFRGGTFRITHPQKDSTYHQHVDKQSCYVRFTVKGSYTLGHGTGRFDGLSGSGTYTGKGYAIAKRKHGACNFNAEPRATLFIVRGHGPATLG